ncbi:MAG: 16S rRNA (uracil(1498)-N(3))-methyltransferase, partial [Bacteroidales bacterium]|nr:16S rRNA (uracil(1498)-N(3))-methyltransferase [Bacteroidales bacterium]
MELFFSDDISGTRVRLDADESAHCVRVLRHRAGDAISVIDGQGTLYRCTLEIADAKGAEAVVTGRVPGFGAHPYHLTMAVCPTKNIDRFEWFVEKATEIGVDVIAPVIGERSERKALKTERLRRLALSATKQSLKAAIPQISEPVSVRDFIAAAPADALKLICHCFDDVERRAINTVLRQPEIENRFDQNGIELL